MGTDRDDSVIVEGLKRRDPQAFEQLVGAYGRLIHFWARSEGAEAEDVVQDVLLRVWRSGHRLAPDTSLPSWLRTVTNNALSDRWRAASRRPSVPCGLAPRATGGTDPLATERSRIAVDQLLGTIPAREREALRLLYLLDLPIKEASTRLDASEEATKSLAARARRRMRGNLRRLVAANSPATLHLLIGRAAEALGGGGVAAGAASVAAATAIIVATTAGVPAPRESNPTAAVPTRVDDQTTKTRGDVQDAGDRSEPVEASMLVKARPRPDGRVEEAASGGNDGLRQDPSAHENTPVGQEASGAADDGPPRQEPADPNTWQGSSAPQGGASAERGSSEDPASGQRGDTPSDRHPDPSRKGPSERGASGPPDNGSSGGQGSPEGQGSSGTQGSSGAQGERGSGGGDHRPRS